MIPATPAANVTEAPVKAGQHAEFRYLWEGEPMAAEECADLIIDALHRVEARAAAKR